jgi:hypothetical protein
LEIGYWRLLSLVSFILTENHCLVEDGCEGAALDSSVNTAPTVRHGVASKIVITAQAFLILSLMYWIVEEYLNNMYLRQYVSDVFAANGLIIGILGGLLMLGSLSSLMLVRRKHGEKKFGAVSLEITSSSPKVKLPATASPKPPEASAKPSLDFHPVVAALKADMADRRLSFGSMPGIRVEQPTTAPVPKVEVQKTSVLDQLTPTRQTPMTGPRPVQTGTSFAQPAVPRVEQVGGSTAPRPLPFLRSEQPTGSSVLSPTQPTTQQMPANVTTVITGIMPAQKKKDPTAPSEEKPSSSQ